MPAKVQFQALFLVALFLIIPVSQFWKFTRKSEMCQVSVFPLWGTCGSANSLKTYTDKARFQNMSGFADFNAWEPVIHFFTLLFGRCALLFGQLKELWVLHAHTFTCFMSRQREESLVFCENIKNANLFLLLCNAIGNLDWNLNRTLQIWYRACCNFLFTGKIKCYYIQCRHLLSQTDFNIMLCLTVF